MRWFIGALVTGLLVVSGPALGEDSAALFKGKCAKCHGEDGKGKTKMGERLKVGDMTTEEFQKKGDDAAFKKQIMEGDEKTEMPSYKDKLKPEEIDQLIKHIRAFRPAAAEAK